MVQKDKIEVDYDKEADSLFVSRKDLEFKESINIANFIIDISKDKKIKAIELLNASEFTGLNKTDLDHLKSARLQVIHHPNYTIIKLFVVGIMPDQQTEIPISIPITVS